MCLYRIESDLNFIYVASLNNYSLLQEDIKEYLITIVAINYSHSKKKVIYDYYFKLNKTKGAGIVKDYQSWLQAIFERLCSFYY